MITGAGVTSDGELLVAAVFGPEELIDPDDLFAGLGLTVSNSFTELDV